MASANLAVGPAVINCGVGGTALTDYKLQSGCGTGQSFACPNQSPWFPVAGNTSFAYGFVAGSFAGQGPVDYVSADH
jgi:hypothetical protein